MFIPATPALQATLRDLAYYAALHQFLAPRLQELSGRISQLQLRKPSYVSVGGLGECVQERGVYERGGLARMGVSHLGQSVGGRTLVSSAPGHSL
jgi:hypothetical protein